MTNRLLHRPKPIPGESFEGYLLRLTETNGYPSGKWITQLAGIDNRVSCIGGDVNTLASVLGHEAALIDAMRYPPPPWAGARHINLFNGRPISRLAINLDRPRVCPLCLKDSAYLRMAWDLAPAAVCHHHRTILVDTCPTCGKGLSWNRSQVCYCGQCGQDLREIEAIPANTGAVDLTGLMLSAADLTDGEPGGAFTAQARALLLNDLVHLTLVLGAAKLGLRSATGFRLCSRLDATEMAGLVGESGNLLADWPKAFHELLTTLANQAPPGRTGLTGDFGHLHGTIHRCLRGPAFAFVRNAMEHYATEHWSGGHITGRNTRFPASRRHSKHYASRAEVSRRLRVRPETVDEMLNMGILDGVVHQAGQRRAILVDRTSLTDEVTDLLELQDVCEMLRISKAPANDLIRAKYLKPLKISTSRAPRRRYRRSDVEELLASVYGDAPEQETPMDLIPLAGVLRHLSFADMGIADLVGEVLAGTITVHARLADKAGLAACLFDKNEILAFVRRQKVSRGDALSVPEAAERLHIKQQVAYQLVKAGLWPVTRAWENGRHIRLISAEALVAFKRDYVTASELAQSAGTSPRRIIETLGSQGIKPVTGPGVDEGRQFFFKRDAPLARVLAHTAFPFGDAVAF